MKVQDYMTAPARSATTGMTLVEAARILFENDIGSLPVLDDQGRVCGIVTDRDLCMAAVRKNRFPASVAVREAMSVNPFSCRPGDEVEEALRTMSSRQVRRLPVVNDTGALVGMISVSDVAAGPKRGMSERRGAHEVHRMVAEALRDIAGQKAPPSD